MRGIIKGVKVNSAIKALFFTTMDLNIPMHMLYVSSQQNLVDAPFAQILILGLHTHIGGLE